MIIITSDTPAMDFSTKYFLHRTKDTPAEHCRHIDLTTGNEDGEIAQRIYRDLVERKWAELHPLTSLFTDCHWFERNIHV